jgi:hypothetical protein
MNFFRNICRKLANALSLSQRQKFPGSSEGNVRNSPREPYERVESFRAGSLQELSETAWNGPGRLGLNPDLSLSHREDFRTLNPERSACGLVDGRKRPRTAKQIASYKANFQKRHARTMGLPRQASVHRTDELYEGMFQV